MNKAELAKYLASIVPSVCRPAYFDTGPAEVTVYVNGETTKRDAAHAIEHDLRSILPAGVAVRVSGNSPPNGAERIGADAPADTIPLRTLARAVMLDPSSATREQILARIDALTREPRSICAAAETRAAEATRREREANARLERALCELRAEKANLIESEILLGRATRYAGRQ